MKHRELKHRELKHRELKHRELKHRELNIYDGLNNDLKKIIEDYSSNELYIYTKYIYHDRVYRGVFYYNPLMGIKRLSFDGLLFKVQIQVLLEFKRRVLCNAIVYNKDHREETKFGFHVDIYFSTTNSKTFVEFIPDD